jgi:WD40 repeat protein
MADKLAFLVLPSQVAALETLAEWLSSTRATLTVRPEWPQLYPAMLISDNEFWVAHQASPTVPQTMELLRQLRVYLGALLFQWLCACAVFPTVSEPLTLAFGRKLSDDPAELVMGLAALGALPWFRYGAMPHWLRRELLSHLAAENESLVRDAIESLLDAALIETGGTRLADIALRKRRLAAWLRSDVSIAGDAVLVDFLTSGRLARLAHRLPSKLMKALFPQGVVAYGLRPRIAALVGAVGAVALTTYLSASAEIAKPTLISAAELSGRGGALRSAHFSPDGLALVTSSEDGTARIWSLAGAGLAELNGHTGPVYDATFSPDGTVIATASQDSTVRLWSLDGQTIDILSGHSGAVYEASFSPEGGAIATASADGTARLWSREGKQLAVLIGHSGPVKSVTFSPDGEIIATASADGTARLWSREGKQLAVLSGHSGPVNDVAYSPDGKYIATASSDRTARLWSASGQFKVELRGHTGEVGRLTFSPDSQTIITVSDDRTARLWRVDGTPGSVMRGHGDTVTDAAFSPDGKLIATGSLDQTARLWSNSGDFRAELKGHRAAVISVLFSPAGSTLLTASADGTARMWGDAPTGVVLSSCDMSAPTRSASSSELSHVVTPQVRELASSLQAAFGFASSTGSYNVVAYPLETWPGSEVGPIPQLGTLAYADAQTEKAGSPIKTWLADRWGKSDNSRVSSWRWAPAMPIAPVLTNVVRIGLCALDPLMYPDGNWEGTYYYGDKVTRPVSFRATLWSQNGRFQGKTQEANTFGGPKKLQTASLDGALNGDIGTARFTKLYDHTETVPDTWSVFYFGNLYKGGQNMEGTWALTRDGQVARGTFSMHKD